MNQKKVKKIRNNMFYPRTRRYVRDENDTIHADQPRKDYQAAKKAAV